MAAEDKLGSNCRNGRMRAANGHRKHLLAVAVMAQFDMVAEFGRELLAASTFGCCVSQVRLLTGALGSMHWRCWSCGWIPVNRAGGLVASRRPCDILCTTTVQQCFNILAY